MPRVRRGRGRKIAKAFSYAASYLSRKLNRSSKSKVYLAPKSSSSKSSSDRKEDEIRQSSPTSRGKGTRKRMLRH